MFEITDVRVNIHDVLESAAKAEHDAAARDTALAGGGAGPALEHEPATTGVAGGFGARVRSLRQASRLSLRELAERSGVSAPMLSQVERGETSPTLTVAQRIAAGLGLSLSQVLRLDESVGVVIVPAARRRRGGGSDGHTYEVLTPPLPGERVEVSLHRLDPGAATGGPDDPPLHGPGSRETVVVQKGRVRLEIAGERHELAAGDAATFDADLPHHFENPGPTAAEFLAVVTAALGR